MTETDSSLAQRKALWLRALCHSFEHEFLPLPGRDQKDRFVKNLLAVGNRLPAYGPVLQNVYESLFFQHDLRFNFLLVCASRATGGDPGP